MTLYMFRTALPSIIRSSRLYIQQQAYVKQILLSACWRVRDGTGLDVLFEGYLPASRQQYLFDICLLLYVQSWTPDDGRKDRPKYVDCHSKIKYIWYIGESSCIYYRNSSNNFDFEPYWFVKPKARQVRGHKWAFHYCPRISYRFYWNPLHVLPPICNLLHKFFSYVIIF